MVHIEGGFFEMGSPQSEKGHYKNERLHRVNVGNFAIGKYAVTFDEYDFFCDTIGHAKPDDAG